VPRDHFWEKLEPEIEKLVRGAIEALASAGADIVETRFPDAAKYSAAVGPIILVEAAAYHAERYPARKSEYGIGEMLDGGHTVPATAYANALRVMHEARNGAADAALDGVDVLAVPTMPEPPPLIEEIRSGNREVRRTVFTSLLDLTGQPVITVPCGLTSTGLPTGISFVARRWDEVNALRAARAYEIARGPFPTPPLVAN
jgi:aspartyl-tRNA(Asn)/glutamyl-tRNA(Gln) amidotransferase subunit A